MRHVTITALCMLAVMIGSAGLCLAVDEAFAAEAGEPDYIAHGYKIKFISTATDAQHVRWDFGDGTVLDSRSSDPGFADLLAAHGGNVWAPEHQYAEGVNTDYVVTQTVYNPFNGGSEDSVSQLIRIVGPPTVTFDGTSMAPVTVEYVDYRPSVLTRPADPVRDGYVFGGWYSDPGRTTPFDWSTPVAEDTTAYAKWTPVGGTPGDDDDPPVVDGPKHTIKIDGVTALLIITAFLSAVAAVYTRHPVAVVTALILGLLSAAGALGYLDFLDSAWRMIQ